MSSDGLPSSGAAAAPTQKKIFRPFKASSASPSTKSDWLAGSILIATTAAAAGELTPFPYINSALGVLLALLEAVEKLNKNQEDLKELCENITEIVDILQSQISTHGNAAALKLQVQCQEFEEVLQEMLCMVKKMQQQNQLKQFLRSSSIAGEINGYEKRIQRLLSLIQFLTGTSTNMAVMDISATTTDVGSKVDDIHAMLSSDLD
ncbi:hypothetical protein B0H16DRAFT_1583704 [Mycena metata]|uniref:Uncharacterized protein n=1 Tax=Mycena metata TaxID=1033252 RepID=A0AAD7I0D7_9AGAR|nr:hypothetical protein B0H16DRAFT_1583704 [Mycena metata]